MICWILVSQILYQKLKKAQNGNFTNVYSYWQWSYLVRCWLIYSQPLDIPNKPNIPNLVPVQKKEINKLLTTIDHYPCFLSVGKIFERISIFEFLNENILKRVKTTLVLGLLIHSFQVLAFFSCTWYIMILHLMWWVPFYTFLNHYGMSILYTNVIVVKWLTVIEYMLPKLITSFLTNRFQRIVLNSQTSEWQLLAQASVPQGSIFGAFCSLSL